MNDANANCEEIWADKTELVPGHDPQLDDRRVRGRDPHGVVPAG